MAGPKDFYEFFYDFDGASVAIPTSAEAGFPFIIKDTSAAGAPTYTTGTGINGEAVVTMAADSEVENLCLYPDDDLNFDIDLLLSCEMYVKLNQAALDATSMFACGMASARNDAIDSLAAHASFRVIGADSTTAVVVESDDGSNDNDDKATGTTLINAYKKLYIDFSGGTANVKFYVDGARVADTVTFDMSGYTAGLQPYWQLQKTADTNTDGFTVDYVCIRSRRSA